MYQTTLTTTHKVVCLLKFLDLVAAEDKKLNRQLWDHIRTSYHGNQQFSNDTMFIYNVGEEAYYGIHEDGESYEEHGLYGMIIKFADEHDLYSDDSKEYIIFNVCW